MSSPQNRIFGLDIIRATAILLVLYSHLYILLYPSLPLSFEVIFNTLSWFAAYVGVDLFFVLSGFLIGGIFLSKVDSSTRKKEGLISYFISRFCRTLPNYFFYLLLSVLLFTLVQGRSLGPGFWRYFFFLQKALPEYSMPLLGVSWSLAVEEWFYLLFPLFYIVLWRFRSSAAYLGAAFSLLSLSWVLKLAFAVKHPGPENLTEAFNFSTFFRLDAIAWGILCAYFWRKCEAGKRIKAVVRKRLFVLSLGATAGLFVYTALFLARNQQFAWAYLLFAPLCSISLLLAFPFLIQIQFNEASWLNRFIIFVSRTSYSLYLSHTIVMEAVAFIFQQQRWLEGQAVLAGWVQIFINILIFTILSVLSYRFVESPSMQFRDFLLRMRRQRQEPAIQ